MLELLLEYGVDTLAETLVEGLSQVRRCNNEGRALMSLDLQVRMNHSWIISIGNLVVAGVCACKHI